MPHETRVEIDVKGEAPLSECIAALREALEPHCDVGVTIEPEALRAICGLLLGFQAAALKLERRTP